MNTSQKVAARYVSKSAMEHPTEDARDKYLRDHPNADPRNHKVEHDPDSNSSKRRETMKGVAELMDFNTKGMTLPKPSWDGVRQIKKDLQDGKAKPSDLRELAEDLDFVLKREIGGKANMPKVKKLMQFLKEMSHKWEQEEFESKHH